MIYRLMLLDYAHNQTPWPEGTDNSKTSVLDVAYSDVSAASGFKFAP